MSADVLRKAAALMRERAEAATPGGPRWEIGPDEMHGPSQSIIYPADSDSAVAFAGADDAPHIASWHPAVALAAADLLDYIADRHEQHAVGLAIVSSAENFARAFLGADQ
jgi:hypothetical protein